MTTPESGCSPSELSGLQVGMTGHSKCAGWFVWFAISLGVLVIGLVGMVVLRGAADLSSGRLFLHGTGTQANPSSLFLDAAAPTSSAAKYKDSGAVNFNGGNPWTDIGTWTTTLEGSTSVIPTAVDTWVGLKNSDDIGTAFDLRAEVYQDNRIVASGETRCITGITRNATQAKSVNVPLTAVDLLTGPGTLRLKLVTRIGTNSNGTRCSGPGFTHSNATGLRVYFDAADRASKLAMSVQEDQVAWTPSNVTRSALIGTVSTVPITFVSRTPLGSVQPWVVPELAPYVTFFPPEFDAVPANTPLFLTLVITIPKRYHATHTACFNLPARHN